MPAHNINKDHGHGREPGKQYISLPLTCPWRSKDGARILQPMAVVPAADKKKKGQE